MKPEPLLYMLVRNGKRDLLETAGWKVSLNIASTQEEKAMAISFALAEKLRMVRQAQTTEVLFDALVDLIDLLNVAHDLGVTRRIDDGLLALCKSKAEKYIQGEHRHKISNLASEKLSTEGGYSKLLIIAVATPPEE